MSENEVLNLVKSLSNSQGSYGRMYAGLMKARENEPECYDAFMKDAERFTDSVSLIMYWKG